MRLSLVVLGSLALSLAAASDGSADVLVRWDQAQIPSPVSLGVGAVAIPASNEAAVGSAIRQGYRVWLELQPASLAGIRLPPTGVAGILIAGGASAAQVQQVEKQIAARNLPVIALDERGKWPHIRTNWVTKNSSDVLQVTSRSSQPWIENNAALFRMVRPAKPRPPMLTYPWKPITLAEVDEGPALENYLVAIAEAGSFGGSLVLPLHPRFQQKLLRGDPRARTDWAQIRQYLDFFSWDLPDRHRPVANTAVVTAEPVQAYEVLNLLLRHNLPFELVAPSELPTRTLEGVDLLIVLDPLKDGELKAAAAFASGGGALSIAGAPAASPWRTEAATAKNEQRASYRYGKGRVLELLTPVADPNAFALEMRRLLGAGHRMIDIWNGITVLTTAYDAPDDKSVLVTAVNYAAQPLPVQLRVRGTFSVVHYESPEEPLALLPHQHRGGYTEFVLPALRVAGRVFLGN